MVSGAGVARSRSRELSDSVHLLNSCSCNSLQAREVADASRHPIAKTGSPYDRPGSAPLQGRSLGPQLSIEATRSPLESERAIYVPQCRYGNGVSRPSSAGVGRGVRSRYALTGVANDWASALVNVSSCDGGALGVGGSSAASMAAPMSPASAYKLAPHAGA